MIKSPSSRGPGRPRHERPANLSGEIGIRVESLRKAKCLSQVQFAELAGIAFGTVARIERGRSPSIDSLVAIAHALVMSPAALLARIPSWTANPSE